MAGTHSSKFFECTDKYVIVNSSTTGDDCLAEREIYLGAVACIRLDRLNSSLVTGQFEGSFSQRS